MNETSTDILSIHSTDCSWGLRLRCEVAQIASPTCIKLPWVLLLLNTKCILELLPTFRRKNFPKATNSYLIGLKYYVIQSIWLVFWLRRIVHGCRFHRSRVCETDWLGITHSAWQNEASLSTNKFGLPDCTPSVWNVSFLGILHCTFFSCWLPFREREHNPQFVLSNPTVYLVIRKRKVVQFSRGRWATKWPSTEHLDLLGVTVSSWIDWTDGATNDWQNSKNRESQYVKARLDR